MNKDGSLNIKPDEIEQAVVNEAAFKSLKKIGAGADIPKFTLAGKIFPCKCINIYDGDTIHVAVKFNGSINDFTIRMYGYNSAELRTKNDSEKEKGYAAKKYISDLILGKNLLIHFIDNDKYGNRWLGNVYLVEDGNKCVNKLMISGGHGVEYFGKGQKKY